MRLSSSNRLRARGQTAPELSEHDAFARQMRKIENGCSSPLKARRERRPSVPLQLLLDQVLTNPEATRAATAGSFTNKLATTAASGASWGVKRGEDAAGVESCAPQARRPRSGQALVRRSSAGSISSSSSSSNASTTVPSTRRAVGAAGGLPAHLRKDIMDLFAAHSASVEGGDHAPIGNKGSNGRVKPAAIDASTRSFRELLRAYYPQATAAEIDTYYAVAAPNEEELRRRKWVEHTKKVHGEEIRRFFGAADADGDGGIDLGEFASAVKELGLSGSEVRDLFRSADSDGNGMLDLEEFTELVASNKVLLESFGDIMKLGEEKRRKAEEKRLAQLFRNNIGAGSPSGRRRRPSLADLRRVHEVDMPSGWTPPKEANKRW